MRSRHAFILALMICASACADSPPSLSGAPTSGEQASGPEITASCGGATFPSLPPDPSAFEPFDRWADVDFAGFGAERGFFDGYHWFVAEETAATLQLFGQPHSETSERQATFASAGFESEGGVWTPTGFGNCRIELSAEGWGNARFDLDPSAQVDPESSTVSVLATETNCASGQPPDGRDVRAVVLDETPDAVSIVILVEPVNGGANCQGNPEFPFEVDVGSPIGDRHVLDASVYPPIDASAPSEFAAPSVAEVTCRANGRTELLTPEVEVQPDGVHVLVTSEMSDPMYLLGLPGGPEQDVAPGETREIVWATAAPGDIAVVCYPPTEADAGDRPTMPLHVSDPAGLYVDPTLDCDIVSGGSGSTIYDGVGVTNGDERDPVERVAAELPRVLPDDWVTYAGYPASDERRVAVIRDGSVIAVYLFQPVQTGWVYVGDSTCNDAHLGQLG